MSESVKRIVIVGGGSAGWLTAAVLAAEHRASPESDITITLIESPDVRPIGVGEGTWPSMRSTLHKIGVSETDFIRQCDASFKQGTHFSGWTTGRNDDYFHPFTLPLNYQESNPAIAWQSVRDQVSFAEAVCPQSHLCRHNLAPKTIATPEYAFNANYGYHLDAGKFSMFLQNHCTQVLGVTHVQDHVTAINSKDNGDIASVTSKHQGDIIGDLFIDCTGFASMLLGQHYQVPFIPKSDILFNDSALAVQVPYGQGDDAIASTTGSVAQEAGWIWDIGLPTRRGVGYVYSSQHTTQSIAETTLRHYLSKRLSKDQVNKIEPRKLNIKPGHRAYFWHRNCVAVGLSAGFLEPLEASALVLVELSAQMISEQLPARRETMDIVARRFNQKFLHHWARIIEFLKLHYLLTQRTDSDYWRDNVRPESVPDSLRELLSLWRYQYPWHSDTVLIDEMFPSASYQYVLYGMRFETRPGNPGRRSELNASAQAEAFFRESAQKARQLVSGLPSNRALIEKIHEFGLQKI